MGFFFLFPSSSSPSFLLYQLFLLLYRCFADISNPLDKHFGFIFTIKKWNWKKLLAARGVGGCHFSFYQVPCLRLTQCCLSCCTIIGGGHTVKIACENNHGCQGSMTLLCPDSSWQRSGRVDKISTRRREFLKDCSHTAMLQNKEKGETGDNGRLVSARICSSFP